MSTKVKTTSEIAVVRKLISSGRSLKSVAKELKYSINTIRKIMRNPDVSEFPKQQRKFSFKSKGVDYVSPIDSEKLKIYKNPEGYWRVSYRDSNNMPKRELLHIHESKKLMAWNDEYVVHHIDMDKSNCRPENLHVFENHSEHGKHHKSMEFAMYKYLIDNNALEDFYVTNPELRLASLGSKI
jgi:hypothetical protein